MEKVRSRRDIFLSYILPGIGGMLGVSLYVLGDTMLVGRGLGAPGLTALNIAIPMINVLNAFGLMFGIGGATLISKALGEGKPGEADRLFTKALALCVGAGFVITLLSLFFLDELCLFLGASPASFPMVKDYLGTYLSFAFPFILFSGATVLVRNDRGSRLVMVAMLAGSVFNVLFDYIFIFPLGMGMRGSALATGLAPCLGLAILSFHYLMRNNHLNLSAGCLSLRDFFRVVSAGLAGFVLELSSGIIIFAFNAVILGLDGDRGVSGYSIVANLSLLIVAVFQGISYGVQPLISFHEGAGDQPMLRKVFRLGMWTALGLGLFFFALGQLFPRALASLFITGDEAILRYTVPAIRLYFIAFLFMGPCIVWTMKYQARNQVLISLALSLLRGLALLLICLYALSALFGMKGVWLALAVTEAGSLMALFTLGRVKRRKNMAQN